MHKPKVKRFLIELVERVQHCLTMEIELKYVAQNNTVRRWCELIKVVSSHVYPRLFPSPAIISLKFHINLSPSMCRGAFPTFLRVFLQSDNNEIENISIEAKRWRRIEHSHLIFARILNVSEYNNFGMSNEYNDEVNSIEAKIPYVELDFIFRLSAKHAFITIRKCDDEPERYLSSQNYHFQCQVFSSSSISAVRFQQSRLSLEKSEKQHFCCRPIGWFFFLLFSDSVLLFLIQFHWQQHLALTNVVSIVLGLLVHKQRYTHTLSCILLHCRMRE